jgi:hypothetical protein
LSKKTPLTSPCASSRSDWFKDYHVVISGLLARLLAHAREIRADCKTQQVHAEVRERERDRESDREREREKERDRERERESC